MSVAWPKWQTRLDRRRRVKSLIDLTHPLHVTNRSRHLWADHPRDYRLRQKQLGSASECTESDYLERLGDSIQGIVTDDASHNG